MAAKQHNTPNLSGVSPELALLSHAMKSDPAGFAAALEAEITRDPNQPLAEAARLAFRAHVAGRAEAMQRPCPIPARVSRDLEHFVAPLNHACFLLARLNHEDIGGYTGGAEAVASLAEFAHERAHELLSIVDGRRPRFATDEDANERARILAALPDDAE